ncbi:MAG: DUF3293 domain-containing protein [Phycisphaeraceae bacterium]
MARLSRELEQAYRRTSYTAETPRGVITLRIGEPCPELAELMREHGAKTAAYLTAMNPRSEILSDEENAKRLAELDALLQSEGWMFFKGKAIADTGDWPDEDSRLIIGMDVEDGALELGYCLGQKAIVVVSGEDPSPQLYELPENKDRPLSPSDYQRIHLVSQTSIAQTLIAAIFGLLFVCFAYVIWFNSTGVSSIHHMVGAIVMGLAALLCGFLFWCSLLDTYTYYILRASHR